MKSVKQSNRQLWSIISTAPFYLTLVTLTLRPQLLVGVVRFDTWTVQLYLLTLWAWLALIGFFVASAVNVTHKSWQKLTFLNACLVIVPLYFLWLTFMGLSKN